MKDCKTAKIDTAYDHAVSLMDAGKYNKAIKAFKSLNGHKDSAEKITMCETAIKDAKYNEAISLLEKGDIINAYESLIALNGYNDSAEKAEEIFGKYKIEKMKTASVGDIVYFGAYEQDNNIANGKEEIEWLVLAKEKDRVLLISKYALDCQQYNTSYTGVTLEPCSLRKWLNGTFINAAFSNEEQNRIISSTVTADENPSYSTSPGNNTTDKVFLLSIPEVNQYFSSNEARKCAPTDYAIAQGAVTSGGYTTGGRATCSWWLRSPGYGSDYAASVIYGGSVYNLGIGVNNSSVAVRPALWIDLGS